jgi:hypothetical protein
MSQRLIPRSDEAFCRKVGAFARTVSKDPERYALSANDAETMLTAATRFETAWRASAGSMRSSVLTREKTEARGEAERLYKRFIELIRVSDRVDTLARCEVSIVEATGTRRSRECPQEPPRLKFARALHEGSGAAPMHELTFCGLDRHFRGPKPAGAVRMELFVDLVPPDEPVPEHPGGNHGGRPWYLRSFSRSPIRIMPPLARVPMLVVYWGRWADATGNVGPWCSTVVSRVEGYSRHVFMSAVNFAKRPVKILDDATPREDREQKYSVAVRDVQYEYLNENVIASPKRETPQIEGPSAASEAA